MLVGLVGVGALGEFAGLFAEFFGGAFIALGVGLALGLFAELALEVGGLLLLLAGLVGWGLLLVLALL